MQVMRKWKKMEECSSSSCRAVLMFLTNILLILSSSSSLSRSGVEAYKNYTVGESLGWYDTLENPNVNYQKWVSTKDFTLGDFLLFNTDTNHSVIQTYNLTTYEDCNYDDALDSDTVQWSSADPSNTSPTPVFIAVPLLKVGLTYFFSSDYDGEQCQNGQRFKINVTYGQGLPPALAPPSQNISPSPSYSVSDDDNNIPDSSVPSNFLDHPRHSNPSTNNDDDHDDDSNNNETSGTVRLGVVFSVYVLFGFIYIF